MKVLLSISRICPHTLLKQQPHIMDDAFVAGITYTTQIASPFADLKNPSYYKNISQFSY